jgi:hypothetical protein
MYQVHNSIRANIISTGTPDTNMQILQCGPRLVKAVLNLIFKSHLVCYRCDETQWIWTCNLLKENIETSAIPFDDFSGCVIVWTCTAAPVPKPANFWKEENEW